MLEVCRRDLLIVVSRYVHSAALTILIGHLTKKMQMKLEGNLYLFQCEQCKGVLSSPVPDVTGYNNTMLTTTGLLKKLSGKKNGVIYLRVYDAGNNADFADKVGTEYTLEEINQMAAQKGGTPDQGGKFY